MNRLLRALVVTAATTGIAYLIWSKMSEGDGGSKVKLVPPVKEVDIDTLPENVRKELLSELDEQL